MVFHKVHRIAAIKTGVSQHNAPSIKDSDTNLWSVQGIFSAAIVGLLVYYKWEAAEVL